MKLKMDTRLYTNFILSVIAVLLLALTLGELGVTFGRNAQAQQVDFNAQGSRFARPGRSAPVDVSNISQTQDTAVAAATSEIAAANRDIAAAIRELARGVEVAGNAIQTSPRSGSANVTTGEGATRTFRPTTPEDATRPTVEVAPSVENP